MRILHLALLCCATTNANQSTFVFDAGSELGVDLYQILAVTM